MNGLLNLLEDQVEGRLQLLASWSDDMEDLLFGKDPQPASATEATLATRDQVDWCSERLLAILLQALLEQDIDHLSFGSDVKEFSFFSEIDRVAQFLEQNPVLSSNTMDLSSMSRQKQVLRTVKNFLRWFLQIFMDHNSHHVNRLHGDPILVWKQRSMFDLYLQLLERFVPSHHEWAQHAAQIMFYASYNPISGSDENLQAIFDDLMGNKHLFPRFLSLILRSEATPLSLSLVRNVHNALASFPSAKNAVSRTVVPVSTLPPAENLAPWVITNDMSEYTFAKAFCQLTNWCLQSDPTPFPGDLGDRRAELIVEVMRSLYALQAGRDMHDNNNGLSNLVLKLLLLDVSGGDVRLADCARSSMPLIMEAPLDFADVLMTHVAVNPLLRLFESQLSTVLQDEQIDDIAAAALTPFLATLHRFSGSNDKFRSKVKDYIFPVTAEATFNSLVEQERSKGPKAKNIAPLDAPPSTLRGKVIRLLTWPHGHIKRFAGELLWVLTNRDAEEFIHRVGLGNGLPILSAKGLAALPAGI